MSATAEVPTGNTYDKDGSSHPLGKRLMGGFHSTLDELWAQGTEGRVVGIEVLEHVPDPEHTVAEMARVASSHLLVSVPREPLWRALNVARGAYLRDLGNTPGHVNHWSKVGFCSLLQNYGRVHEVRKPFPWTMVLVDVGSS